MKPRWILITAVGVVVMLVLAYWAFIGFNEAVDDFEGGSDDDGASGGGSNEGNGPDTGDEPGPGTYLAYATFHLSYTLGTHAVTSSVPYVLYVSDVSITPTVLPYVSMSQGKMYERSPGLRVTEYDPGDEMSAVKLSWYAIVTVTGPGGYVYH